MSVCVRRTDGVGAVDSKVMETCKLRSLKQGPSDSITGTDLPGLGET